MTRDDIIATARSVIGVRFRHQGRDASTGLDCAGLLQHIAAAHGFQSIDVQGYPRHPNGELEQALAANVAAGVIVPVPLGKVQGGDMVLMHFEKEPRPRHLGIIGNHDMLIHAYAVAGKVVEHRIDEQWRRRIVKAWRFTGVEQ